jgi:hypothetical protein
VLDPRLLLALAVLVVLLGLFVGGVCLVRIWRRPDNAILARGEERLTQEDFARVFGFLPVDDDQDPHRGAIAMRSRAADPREAEHASVLLGELRSGPQRRPLDWEHRRGVPIHHG